MLHCMNMMVKHEGVGSLYKGLSPTLVGIAPYAALNFASYDMFKTYYYQGERYGRAANSVISQLRVDCASTTLHSTNYIVLYW